MKKFCLVFGLFLFLAVPVMAQDAGSPADPAAITAAEKAAREEGKVTGYVKQNPRLKTMAMLLEVSGLDEELANPPPSQKQRYSLFAPTEEAFAKMPKSTFDDLLKPANKQKLKNFINHHIVVGKFVILPYPQDLQTEYGRITVSQTRNGAYHYGTATAEEDVKHASNGVVYLIDTVQMPKE